MTILGGKRAIFWLSFAVTLIAVRFAVRGLGREDGILYFSFGDFFGMVAVPYVNAYVGLLSKKKSVVAGCRFLAWFYVALFLPGALFGAHDGGDDGPNLAFFFLPLFMVFLSSFAYLLYYIFSHGLSGEGITKDD